MTRVLATRDLDGRSSWRPHRIPRIHPAGASVFAGRYGNRRIPPDLSPCPRTAALNCKTLMARCRSRLGIATK